MELLCSFFAVEVIVDTLGQLGPVSMEAALPANTVAGKQPVGIQRVWPETFAPSLEKQVFIKIYDNNFRSIINMNFYETFTTLIFENNCLRFTL
jgi:hypothetical protein